MKTPDYSGMGAAYRPHNASFGATAGAEGADLNQHAVAVHGRSNSRRWNENVSSQARFQTCVKRTGVGNDEAKTVAVHAQPSNHKVLAWVGLRDCVAIGVNMKKVAAGHQPFEALRKFVACIAVKPQFAHQLLEAGGVLGLALDLLQNGGVGEHEESLVVGP